MRRVLLLALACCGLLAIGPAATQARSHHRHHHKAKRHARHHSRRHARKFGDVPSSGSSATGGSDSTTSPDAGTVASFTSNVLTIKLNDGSTVSGTVTSDT